MIKMLDILYSYPTWVAIISIYSVVDLVYLFIFSSYLKQKNNQSINKKIMFAKCIIINVGSSFFFPILTFTSVIFGIGNILDGSKLEYWNERIGYSILNYYIYDNVWSAGGAFIGFIITIFLVYQIARRWIFNKLDIKKALAKKYALTFAVVTAPWMLLYPEFIAKVENFWCYLFNVDGITFISFW